MLIICLLIYTTHCTFGGSIFPYSCNLCILTQLFSAQLNINQAFMLMFISLQFGSMDDLVPFPRSQEFGKTATACCIKYVIYIYMYNLLRGNWLRISHLRLYSFRTIYYYIIICWLTQWWTWSKPCTITIVGGYRLLEAKQIMVMKCINLYHVCIMYTSYMYEKQMITNFVSKTV